MMFCYFKRTVWISNNDSHIYVYFLKLIYLEPNEELEEPQRNFSWTDTLFWLH